MSCQLIIRYDFNTPFDFAQHDYVSLINLQRYIVIGYQNNLEEQEKSCKQDNN